MERGSVQHGARLDEALAEGSELPLRGGGMTEREDLQPELPGADETPDVRIPHDADATSGPDADAVRARSELARWLLPSCFPADAATLITVAREGGAPDDVTAELELLPADVSYETVGEVWRALGGEVEVRDAGAEAPPDTALADEAVVEGGVLMDEPPIGDAVMVVGDVSGSRAEWSGRDDAHASALAQVAGLTVAVIDLALVPVRVGVSLVGRVLRPFRGDPEPGR